MIDAYEWEELVSNVARYSALFEREVVAHPVAVKEADVSRAARMAIDAIHYVGIVLRKVKRLRADETIPG